MELIPGLAIAASTDIPYTSNKVFNPSNLPGLMAWWMAEGAIPPTGTLTGTYSVSTWRDSSGNNNHLVKVSPDDDDATYSYGSLNNGPGVSVHGATRFVSTNSVVMGPQCTLIMLCQQTDTASNAFFVSHGDPHEAAGSFALRGNGAEQAVWEVSDNDGGGPKLLYLMANTASWFGESTPGVATFRYSGTSAQYFLNGVEVVDGASALGVAPTGTWTTTEPFYVAFDPMSTYTTKGYFGEILIYNRGLSDAERSAVEAYLTKKWHLS